MATGQSEISVDYTIDLSNEFYYYTKLKSQLGMSIEQLNRFPGCPGFLHRRHRGRDHRFIIGALEYEAALLMLLGLLTKAPLLKLLLLQ